MGSWQSYFFEVTRIVVDCLLLVSFWLGRIVLFGVLHFEVFGLQVGSSAFPTPFRRVIRFVTSWTFWVFLFGILPVVALLFLLSFEFSAVVLDVPRIFDTFAGGIWVNPRRKKTSSRSCCWRGGRHCRDRNFVTSLK